MMNKYDVTSSRVRATIVAVGKQ